MNDEVKPPNIFFETSVFIERYKANPQALALLKAAADKRINAHISHITIAELFDIMMRNYGEKEALTQHAYLKHAPLKMHPTTDEIAKEAGLYRAKYCFSLANGIILATAISANADFLVVGDKAFHDEKWNEITEIKVLSISDCLHLNIPPSLEK